MKSVKVALCVPCYGDPKAKFMQSLCEMMAFSSSAKLEIDGQPAKLEFQLFIVSCSLLIESRNRLVAEAWNSKADYMLWLDADHVFPCDALLRLLGRNKFVVGCNYARRANPTSPTASKHGKDDEMDLVWTTEAKASADEVEEVAHLGLGLCLMDMRSLGILDAQAEKEGKEHFWPLFRMDPTPDGIRAIGEDVHFFKKLREAGIKIYCDHALSWELGHCFEIILTNAHTVAQKKQYEEFTRRKLDHMREAAE